MDQVTGGAAFILKRIGQDSLTIAQLFDENEELKREVAKMRARVTELEANQKTSP
jgi:cell division protein FtsB